MKFSAFLQFLMIPGFSCAGPVLAGAGWMPNAFYSHQFSVDESSPFRPILLRSARANGRLSPMLTI